MDFKNQSHRNELWIVAALVLAVVGTTHNIWNWPAGAPISVKIDAESTTSEVWWTMLNADVIWKSISVISILTVGGLFYLGRRKERVGTGASKQIEPEEAERWRNKFTEEQSAKMLHSGSLDELNRHHARTLEQLETRTNEMISEKSSSSVKDQTIKANEAEIAKLTFYLNEERGAHDVTRQQLNELRNKPAAIAFPNLIVQYWNEGSKPLNEFFELTNYGPGLVQKVTFGSLLISKTKGEESHTVNITVTPFTGLGILQERRPEHMGFHLSMGNHGTDLVTYIRNNLEHGYDTVSKMRIVYEDLEGRVFTRSFALGIDTHNRISMEGDGPVMLYPASTAEPL
jgi:hypothetical protein